MSRKSHSICFDVCGYSRKSRGICFDVCGYSRKSRGICFDVCGYSRKSRSICFDVCGYSRKSRSICFDICGYSRKSRSICFDVCGYSRKSPGICFGVCGESRKCFGELVGRYNMLSMTFSIRVSHSFVKLTSVYRLLKPFVGARITLLIRATVRSRSSACLRPRRPLPGKYAWYMMRWSFTSYPAKLCRRL